MSVLMLLISSPLLIALMVAVKVESRGPAIYRGLRVGRGGKTFHIYKLRSMRQHADRSGPAITARGDVRITRIGHFLRRLKLDELPQLVNVFKGDMSLVGPRPEHPHFVALYTPLQRRVLDVRPGVTSTASIAYRDEEERLPVSDVENVYSTSVLPAKLEMDLAYLDRPTLLGDMKILAHTVAVVATGGHAKRRRPSDSSVST